MKPTAEIVSNSVSSLPRESSDRTYHAVLRHEEQLGNDLRSRRRLSYFEIQRNRFISRVATGLTVTALTTPFVLILAKTTAGASIAISLLCAAATVSAAVVGSEISRRKTQSLVNRMALRVNRLFPGSENPGLEGTDPETYLPKLTESIESTIDRHLEHERDTIISTISSLVSALEAKDPYTRDHSARVAKFAVRVGREMGLSKSALYEIHLSGLLHDVGKIGISDAILLKPTGLTKDEYEAMKAHSGVGARILSGIPGLDGVTEIVHQHHEMYNGRGYPLGLVGEEICLGARLIAVADTYMAMVEDRPYRKGTTLKRIMKEIRRVAGHQLDPQVVDALERMLTREVSTFGSPLEGQFTDVSLGETEPEVKAA